MRERRQGRSATERPDAEAHEPSTLVILDNVESSEAAELTLRHLSTQRVTILSFCPDARIIDTARQRAASHGVEVEVISAAGLLDDVALHVKEQYLRIVAQVPNANWRGSKTLKEAFTFEGRLSLWWLNEISSKRSEVYLTFTRLCQLEVIRRTVAGAQVQSIFLLSRDADFWDVVSSYCEDSGIPFRSDRPERRYRERVKRFVWAIKLLRVTALWMVRATAQTLLAKLLSRNDIPAAAEGGRLCAFYTHYPGHWLVTRGERDEKYQRTPDLVEELSGIPAFFACSFATDSGHQIIPIPRYFSLCRWLSARRKTRPAVPMHLVDRDLRLGDLVRSFMAVSIALKYFWLEANRDFRDRWVVEGVNVFPLFRVELRQAAISTPRYILHILRMRRFTENARPTCFVTNLFEYCYGRGMIYAAKTAAHPPLVIGAQQGLSGRNWQFQYAPEEMFGDTVTSGDFVHSVPAPDHIFLEGEDTRQILVGSGYPSERLHVLGAPRMNLLAAVPRKRPAAVEGPIGPKKVLVTLGLHDGIPMLQLCKQVLQARSNYHFVFKAHPRSGVTSEVTERYLTDSTVSSTYEMATGTFYELLEDSDAVIASYSSTAVEAAAIGYPVVCLQLSNYASPSPLLDVESDVRWATNPQDVISSLDKLLSAPGGSSGARNVEELFFLGVDGQADRRWAERIVELMSQDDRPRAGAS